MPVHTLLCDDRTISYGRTLKPNSSGKPGAVHEGPTSDPLSQLSLQDVSLIEDEAAPMMEAARRVPIQSPMLDRDELLIASEERYRVLYDTMAQGFCIIEPVLSETGEASDYRYVTANAAFETQIGATNIIGKRLRDVMPGEDEARFGVYDEVLLTGNTREFELELRKSNKVLEFHVSRLDARAHPSGTGVALLCHDVTKRRRAEKRNSALLLLGDRLRNLKQPDLIAEIAGAAIGEMLEAAQAAYAIIHADGNSATVLPPWLRDTRVKSLEGSQRFTDFGSYASRLHRGSSVVVADVGSDELTAERRDVFAGAGIEAFVNLPLMKEGRLVGMILVFDDHPRVWEDEDLAFLQSVADRTWAALQTASAEAELRALNLDLENQVETRTADRDRVWRNSQDLLCIIDQDGIILEANPAWTEILGWSVEEVVGRHHLSFSYHEDKAASGAALLTTQTERLLGHESRLLHRDGGFRWMSWAALCENTLTYASGRHVTAEKKAAAALGHAENLLQQAQKVKAMGELVGGVAHDFNNLLTPIIGSLDALVQRSSLGARELRLIDGALQSAERAKILVQRLLSFARRQPLQTRAIDLNILVTGMSDLISSTIGPQIAFVLDIETDLRPVKVDPIQIEMAVLNLCVNARDAMPGGGTLRIAATVERVEPENASKLASGEYVRLSVADTGEGMDATTIARAVEPFYSTKGIGKGTGLGLSMVDGLASQLGGTMILSSTLGAGTIVSIFLPVTEDPVAPPFNPPVEIADIRALGCILLVDDEPLVRASTADMLIDLGYTVVDVASSKEALAVIDRGVHIDGLVSDYLMPEMSGVDLAHAVRKRRPGMPTLIVSGYADTEVFASDLCLLNKPFRQSDLAAHLVRLLHR